MWRSQGKQPASRAAVERGQVDSQQYGTILLDAEPDISEVRCYLNPYALL